MQTEIVQKTSFSTIRYAQCWEDADILLERIIFDFVEHAPGAFFDVG